MNDTDLRMFQSLFTEPEPAPQVVAAGRARLQHSYRRPGFRLPRLSVPVLAGLGTAAAAAAVVVVAISAIAPPAPGSARPAPGSAPRAVISLTASQVLLTAARTVASLPAAQPSPQQWLLISSVEYQAGAKAVTSREWTTFNGVRSAYYQAGKLTHSAPVPAAIGDGSPMGAYDVLRKLPPYPQNLLAALSRVSAGQVIAEGSTQARAWQNIVQLLWNSPVAAPSKEQAEIFIALTKIPGLRVEHLNDALGKPAIGLYLPAAGHSDLLLDPHTYQVVGRLSVSNGRYTKAEREMAKLKKFTLYPAGTITWSIVRSSAPVSGPGQS